MATIPLPRLTALLSPFLGNTPTPPDFFDQLSLYLDLLLKWNARTNLTAIRDPEAIVTRHFGESLFLATHLPAGTETVLDLGSGAGFPGLPCQLLHPALSVTLAESQGKKAAFLHEVVRNLSLPIEIHSGRAEALVGFRRFDLVMLRAVDKMTAALALAAELAPIRLVLTTAPEVQGVACREQWRVPASNTGILALL